MTLTIQAPTIFTSIAALTYPTGVTCVDIAAIPENGNMVQGILYPNPDPGLFQTTAANIKNGDTTFGTNGTEKINLEYEIAYRYLHYAKGGGAVLLGEALASAVAAIVGIMAVFVNHDTLSGAVDVRLKSMGRWPTTVTDPAGNSFWGCDFTLHVIEYLQ